MTTDPEQPALSDAGDLVWVDLRPTLGHEQRGVRPALVLTDRAFHSRNAAAIICPITGNVRPWPTKTLLPPGLAVQGAILTDQIRSVDRAMRGFRRIGRVPDDVLDAVRSKIAAIIGLSPDV
ncbi:type II toxin-antitoxin system PemK/MazF family toxin [Methylobacterium trifolii]|uniref:Endoribonuclease toxin MazF n=1 Tax=Methylobacterium trifolii TaxID=1003092 RepID=A0ABQ4TXK0_9HYPH|nr:type II toxin-antitoxin system PemK/MazF family toxin [Methylobacterium trifolii]GJE58325.1 Endoribonuclease toxin MazF [Methylobacterium trifolii]